MTTDLAWIKARREELWTLFGTFHAMRQDFWRPLVRREMPVKVPDSLRPYWADMQDPVLEDDLSQRVGILMLEQTKIDATAMSEGTDYERDVEKIRLWSAVSQLKQNKGRWRDQHIAEGQVVDGVDIIRKLWDMPLEPDGLESDEDREEYFKDLDNWPFREVGIDSLQCAWDGEDMEKPDIFIQEAEKRYHAAKESWSAGKGKAWQLDEAGKVVILGPDTRVGEPANASGKTIKFLICDYKEPKTGRRMICEYIYPAGEWENGELVREVESPLNHCSYFVIPSGELRRHETNPHLRYRPMMYALITVVYTYNFVMTLLAALAQRAISDRNIYIDPKSPEIMHALEGVSVTTEGAGALRTLTFQPPQLVGDEIPVMPGTLEPYPNNISDALQVILAETKEKIASFRSSRFLTGDVSDVVVARSTASTFSANTQAAGLPFGRALVMSDEFQRQDIESEHAAIRYWDDGKPDGAQKPWYATAPMEMPFLKGKAEPGETVRMTAKMLRRKFLVNVQTSNQTRQEHLMETQQAFLEWDKGTLDDLQLYRRLGHDDPRAQQKVMGKYEARKIAAAQYIPFYIQKANRFLELTGADPTLSMGTAQPGAASISPPAAPPATNGVVPTPQLVRPGVGPPAIAGPSGGSGPLAGLGGLGG